ncbi:MAG: hypothetical protein ACJ8AW_32495 [Rhodopila sp.]
MPVSVIDKGQDNIVDIDPNVLTRGSGTIVLDGNDNAVSIKSSTFAVGINFHLTGGTSVTIAEQLNTSNLFVCATPATRVRLGHSLAISGAVRLLLHEPGSITVRSGCLFAGDIDITVSDMHSVIDSKTRRRINPAGDITIGDRVWIGQRCMLLNRLRKNPLQNPPSI